MTLNGLCIDQLKFQSQELRRIQKGLDEDSQAYRNLDDAIQSISLAIDEGTGPSVEDWKGESEGVEANTSVEDWK